MCQKGWATHPGPPTWPPMDALTHESHATQPQATPHRKPPSWSSSDRVRTSATYRESLEHPSPRHSDHMLAQEHHLCAVLIDTFRNGPMVPSQNTTQTTSQNGPVAAQSKAKHPSKTPGPERISPHERDSRRGLLARADDDPAEGAEYIFFVVGGP